MMSKEELLSIEVKNLKRLKNRLRKEISESTDESLNESMLDYLSDVDDVIQEKKEETYIKEDMELREEDMELVDYGDGVEYEVWEDKNGQLYRVPIERASEEEEYENKEVMIDRFFDQAYKVSSAHAAKFGENDADTNESELSTDDEITDDPINEDGDGGGAGVAMASQGSVSGMGNVVASQPASTPGAAFTGDGTVGSGDIGMPLQVYTKKGATGQKYVKTSKKMKKNKDKKLMADISNFLQTHKKGGIKSESGVSKMLDYQEFVKGETTKVTKVKK